MQMNARSCMEYNCRIILLKSLPSLVSIELSSEPRQKPRKLVQKKRRSWPVLRGLMLRSRHCFVRNGSTVRCEKCFRSAKGPKELRTWLRRGVCPQGPVEAPKVEARWRQPLSAKTLGVLGRTHGSHRVQGKLGVVLCLRCGRCGSSRPKGLLRPCKGRQTAGGKAAVNRWVQGLHPNPKGIWEQPERRARDQDRVELEVSSGSD